MSQDQRYVPILRAKRAELTALAASVTLSGQMTPLVEMQPLNADVMSGAISKRVNEIVNAWYHPLFLDVQAAFEDSEVDPAEGYQLVRVAARSIREDLPIPDPQPVVDLQSPQSFLTAVRLALSDADEGPANVCVRIRPEQLGRVTQFVSRLDALLAQLRVGAERVHLVLDLGSQVNTLNAEVLTMVMPERPWAGYTLAWGAFPTALAPDELQVHGRRDWTAWVDIHDALSLDGYPAPGFGDYGVVSAEPPTSGGRNPNPNLRVTRDLDWLVVRERRDPLEGNAGIYRVAARLVEDGIIEEGLSEGDRWITAHAEGKGTTGNATTWISVGLQRHFAFVSRQLANRPGPSMPQ